MAPKKKKPKVGFQVEPEDKRALDAIIWLVQRDMPGLGEQSASIVMRAALRLGLTSILDDPNVIVATRPPDVAEVDARRREVAIEEQDKLVDEHEQAFERERDERAEEGPWPSKKRKPK